MDEQGRALVSGGLTPANGGPDDGLQDTNRNDHDPGISPEVDYGLSLQEAQHHIYALDLVSDLQPCTHSGISLMSIQIVLVQRSSVCHQERSRREG